MADVKEKRVRIYIDQNSAEIALQKLQGQADKLTVKIKEGQAAGKNMTAEIKKLDTVNGSIKTVQDQLDKGLKPTLQQQANLVRQLRNELGRLSENDPEFKNKLEHFKRQNAELQRMQGQLGGVSGGFKSMLGNMIGIAAGAVAFQKVTQFLGDSVQEASDAEQATSRLKNTLRNLGQEDAFERLADKADKMAERFRFLDNDEVVGVFQQLITYGKLTETQINQLLPVIINFAAQQRISVSESASVVIKAMEGNAKALKEYGISIKEGNTVTERMGILMTELAPKVEGAAKAFGETFAGSVATSKQQVADLQEEIGTKLLPAVKGFWQVMASAINGFEIIFKNVYNAAKTLYDYTLLTAGILKDIATLDIKNASRRATQFSLEQEQEKQKRQDKLDTARAEEFAANLAAEAAKKSIQEQEAILNQNLALQQASIDKYGELVKAGKENTDEGRKMKQQLVQDLLVVKQLQNSIDEQKGKKVLGLGNDENTPVISSKKAKEASDNLKKLQADFDRFAEHLKQQNESFFGPANEQSKALRQYFDDLRKLQDFSAKGIVNEDDFNKQLQKIQSTYELTIAKINASKQNKIQVPVEIVPEAPEDPGPTKEMMDALVQTLKDDNKFNFSEWMTGLFDSDNIKKTVSEIASFVAEQLSILNDFNEQKNRRENRLLDQETKQNDLRKKQFERLYNSKAITYQQYQAQITAIDNENEKKKEQLERKQFERNKRLQIAQTLINSAAGAIKLWADPGFPAALPLAIALGIQTIASVAQIASQKFARGGRPKGPGHESGGINLVDSGTGAKLGEMEGDEGIVKKSAMQSGNVYTVTGTPSQIASTLNKRYGGVQWDSMATLQPAYKTRPYFGVDYGRINSSFSRVRFAEGGMVTGSQGAGNAQAQENTAMLMNMLQQTQAVNMQLMQTVQMLQVQLKTPLSVSLKKFDDTRNLQNRIDDDALFN